MEEPLFMFQLIIAVDVSGHRSIYNKLNAPCSGDFKLLSKMNCYNTSHKPSVRHNFSYTALQTTNCNNR